ncbi:MAG: Ig-like domain-containing protein, partial [Chloroflexota bacterium]
MLFVHNLTDTIQVFQVEAQHRESELTFEPTDQQIEVAPQATAEIAIQVSAPRRVLRPSAGHDFDLLITNIDTEAYHQIQAHLSTAPSPFFWLSLVTLLFALLVGLVVGTFFTLEQRIASNQVLMGELLEKQQVQITAVAGINLPPIVPTETIAPSPTNLPTELPTEPIATSVVITVVLPTQTPDPTLTPSVTTPPTVDLLSTIAGPRSYQAQEDNERPIDLYDEGVTPSNYVAEILSTPENGSIELIGNGDSVYRPNPNFFGSDEFDYQVCLVLDTDNCVINSVVLNISAENDPPTIVYPQTASDE